MENNDYSKQISEDTVAVKKDKTLFFRLLSYAKPFTFLVVIALVCMLISTTLSNVRPRLIQITIDKYLVDSSTEVNETLPSEANETQVSKTPEERKNGILKMTVLFGLTVIGTALFFFIQAYLLNKIVQKIIYNIRNQLFNHIKSRSLAYFNSQPLGRLVTRVTNDTQSLSDMYINVFVGLLSDSISVIVIVVMMFLLNVKLALIIMVVIPFIFMASLIFRKYIRVINRKTKAQIAKINSSLNEFITGMSIIKIFNREDKVYDDFDTLNRDYFKLNKKAIFMRAVFRPSVEILRAVALAGLIYFGLNDAIKGVIQIGTFYAFTEYLSRLFSPIFNLTETFDIIQDAMSSSERIFTILDDESEIKNPKTPKVLNDVKGKIEFRNVSFSYDNKTPILKNINFTVNPGENIAFVGATGAGKSSIMNLLTRFYDCQDGEILIDDVNIKDLDKYELRKIISTVQQDVFMFTGTIADNIVLENKDIPKEEIIKAAEYVNASRFINRLPNKYEEPVMERGSSLSNGERQLLSFARALIVNPKVLILDEATSSIDTETELLIQDALTKLLKNRTSLTVAHRLSTIKNADKIIVLDQGEIVEVGNHDELIAKNGVYYNLYRLQYKETNGNL